jgi:hypothetical protein
MRISELLENDGQLGLPFQDEPNDLQPRVKQKRVKKDYGQTPERPELRFSLEDHPELKAAAQAVKAGTMSRAEYTALVKKYKPVRPYDYVPTPASEKDMNRGLDADKRHKINSHIADGDVVQLRLDIPAYNHKNVWVPTIHNKSGTAISHRGAAVINNVTIKLPQKGSMNIATGETSKVPIATLKGYWEEVSPEDAKKEAMAALHDKNWAQVGMDPKRHAFFYDRKTERPIIGGSRAVQVGPLVLIKDPIYDDDGEYIYERSKR